MPKKCQSEGGAKEADVMVDYVKPVFLIFVVICAAGAIGGCLAANRARSVIGWSLACALLPPLLLVIYYARPLCEVPGKFRRCANCGEFNRWHEQVCRQCRAQLIR